MSEPTQEQLLNARQYLDDSDWDLDEFKDYLETMDPADFRKYWGTVDIPLLIAAFEPKDEAEPDTARASLSLTIRDDELVPFLLAVIGEMEDAEKKYDQQHDDSHGSGHLVHEAVERLTHMGEYPTDAHVMHEITVAIGLLFNAQMTLARALKTETIAIEEAGDGTPR